MGIKMDKNMLEAVQKVTAVAGAEPKMLMISAQIRVPEFYVGSIPAAEKQVYELFGIDFVQVVAAAPPHMNYYIYKVALGEIVEKLKLYQSK